ncbi:cbb3-type cytochrome oxidase subunit 3 [Rubricoccus marinus]|uniref:CcoQ/FixQ family Cbb3-type cytochrome c oxidase assembly chaperone n=1 Tax=Rubricoccus marinus TaxID=716817 RepID=A0A259TXL6_9BACT|nr:cbb3-type cytochrome c oxidase subunit 3 [Rubricoccus marinus]OZC02440.1 hypothetical protein BSZ36_05280 [Rubricoccus marinus]
MKETVRALETGALAEIAVIAFMVAFVAVCAYAFLLSKKQREDLKNMPLDDAMPAPDAPDAHPRPPASGDGSPSSDVPLLAL